MPSGFLRDVRVLIRNPQYHGFVIAQSLAAATFFIFASGGAYVAIVQMHRSSAEYGAWFALGSIAYMAGNLTSARLTPKLGTHRMIWIGLVMQIGGSLLNLICGLAGLNVTRPGSSACRSLSPTATATACRTLPPAPSACGRKPPARRRA